MTDEQFRSLCNVYGFAPSRSLRELLDTAISQSVLAERLACAALVDANVAACRNNSMLADVLAGNAAAIRARNNT